MNERDNSYETWATQRKACEAWCALVDAALPPFERVIPRDPIEAAFLRSIGTPEVLIGPEGSNTDVTAQPGFWNRMARRELTTSLAPEQRAADPFSWL